jgi:CDP-paratose 2-epimerase
MTRFLVTGGAGFIGSHIAEFYASAGHDVVVFDNLSRPAMFNTSETGLADTIQRLRKHHNVTIVNGDVRNPSQLQKVGKDVDAIFHLAAQTAVTTSLKDPQVDFEINAVGTFNILEMMRRSETPKSLVYASTNKVYGTNVSKVGVVESGRRYNLSGKFKNGIPPDFELDHCEHTPYGCSKLVGDLYAQDYSHTYGIRTAIFRMSCIYGAGQFGVEDQGWVAWFAIATITGRPITIYGDGKQLRDILYISDLIGAFDAAYRNINRISGEVFNVGGGHGNTISLLELLALLEKLTRNRSKINFDSWRHSDQKVYVSDISKARLQLEWSPKIAPEEGVGKLVDWISQHRPLFH